MKDYYKILGIEEGASQEEIRDRWAELTKLYHPDLAQGSETDEKIKAINEAYQVLKDPGSRFEYDLERNVKISMLQKRGGKSSSSGERSFWRLNSTPTPPPNPADE